jgi:hypothetical protein
MTEWPPSEGALDAALAASLEELLGDTPFELRWSLTGGAAVRVHAPHGPVSPRHAEGPEPEAPWSASARCGAATAWLLAPRAPDAAAGAALQTVVDRHTALVLQRLAVHRAALGHDLLEALTHRLRTDVTTLQAVADGALMGMFPATERDEVSREVKDVGRESQRRLSAAREAMSALDPDAACEPEPIADALRAELDGANLGIPVEPPAGETPRAALPAPGWGACARLLAETLASDPRLGGSAAVVRIAPDPLGWAIDAGPRADGGRPAGWTARTLGPLAGAGHIAAAGGGAACAMAVDEDRILVRLRVPAAASL